MSEQSFESTSAAKGKVSLGSILSHVMLPDTGTGPDSLLISDASAGSGAMATTPATIAVSLGSQSLADRRTSITRLTSPDSSALEGSAAVWESATEVNGITLDDVKRIQSGRKKDVVARLKILRRVLEDALKNSNKSQNDIASFIADESWEENAPPFDGNTKWLYPRLHRTAARIIFYCGLSNDKERSHAVKVIKAHDDMKRRGAPPSAQIREIEAQWDFATPLEAFCWKLNNFYKLIWLRRFSPALESCLGRLQAEIQQADLLPESIHHRIWYLAEVLFPNLDTLGVPVKEHDIVVLGYIVLVQKFPDDFPELRSLPNEGMLETLMIAGREAGESGQMPRPVYHEDLFPRQDADVTQHPSDDEDCMSASMSIDSE